MRVEKLVVREEDSGPYASDIVYCGTKLTPDSRFQPHAEPVNFKDLLISLPCDGQLPVSITYVILQIWEALYTRLCCVESCLIVHVHQSILELQMHHGQ